MSEKKLYRSKNQMIAGVCAGLGEYLNIDATVVRVLYVLLSLCTVGFPGILAYLICWMIVPQKP
jgi:phage shock protein C